MSKIEGVCCGYKFRVRHTFRFGSAFAWKWSAGRATGDDGIRTEQAGFCRTREEAINGALNWIAGREAANSPGAAIEELAATEKNRRILEQGKFWHYETDTLSVRGLVVVISAAKPPTWWWRVENGPSAPWWIPTRCGSAISREAAITEATAAAKEVRAALDREAEKRAELSATKDHRLDAVGYARECPIDFSDADQLRIDLSPGWKGAALYWMRRFRQAEKDRDEWKQRAIAAGKDRDEGMAVIGSLQRELNARIGSPPAAEYRKLREERDAAKMREKDALIRLEELREKNALLADQLDAVRPTRDCALLKVGALRKEIAESKVEADGKFRASARYWMDAASYWRKRFGEARGKARDLRERLSAELAKEDGE